MALTANEITSGGEVRDVDNRLVVVGRDGDPLGGEKTATADAGASSVSVGSSTTTIVAANSDRIKVIITNDSDETIYLGYGTAAVANKGVRLNANGGSIVETNWTGAINGICASGSKVATVVEF